MTAWREGGRTFASPSRLARAAPPLRGCGLDRLQPPRPMARKRSWFKGIGTAPFATRTRVPWRIDRPFHPGVVCAILAQCPGADPLCATAPRSANCRPDLYVVPGPWPRLGRPVKHDVESWRVVDDWPARVPVTDAEIDVFEAWFGDLFDELFGPSR